jgi:hypothetical protein
MKITSMKSGMVVAALALAEVALTATSGCGSSGSGGSGGNDGAAGSGGSGGIDAPVDRTDGASDRLDAIGDGLTTALSFTFDTSNQGFEIDPFPTTNPVNLGAPLDGAVLAMSAFDSAIGMPTPGSLNITATFTDASQVVAVRHVYATGATVNLAGKVLHAQVRLDSTGSAFSGGVQLYALSTPVTADGGAGFYYARGNPLTLTNDNQWHDVSFNLASPAFVSPGFDASQIVHVGVQFATNPPSTDGGTAFGAPETISAHFDTLISN